MPTFGLPTYSSPETGAANVDANQLQLSCFVLPEPGLVSKLSMYMSGTQGGSGTALFKGVIYDFGSDCLPDNLLGTSQEASLASAQGYDWRDMTFAAAVALEAGRYYLGLLAGGDTDILVARAVVTPPVEGGRLISSATYGSGPPDPWVSGTPFDHLMQVLAYYDKKTPAQDVSDSSGDALVEWS